MRSKKKQQIKCKIFRPWLLSCGEWARWQASKQCLLYSFNFCTWILITYGTPEIESLILNDLYCLMLSSCTTLGRWWFMFMSKHATYVVPIHSCKNYFPAVLVVKCTPMWLCGQVSFGRQGVCVCFLLNNVTAASGICRLPFTFCWRTYNPTQFFCCVWPNATT